MKLEKKYYQYYTSKMSEWHKKRIGEYHASMVYDIVKGYLKPKDFFKKKEEEPISLHYMDTGSLWHGQIGKMYENQEYTEREIRIPIDDFEIIGRVDLFIDNKVCELKTCENFPKNVYQSHKYQVICYMKALNKNKAFVTYVKVRGGRPLFPEEETTKNFIIPFSEVLWNQIVKGVQGFHNEVKELYGTK